MSGNNIPQFTSAANFGSTLVTAANTKSDGTGTIGTDMFKAFTAGAFDSFVDHVDFIATATAPTQTTQTVGRVFLSSQSANGAACTNLNTYLVGEAPLPPTNADNAIAAVNTIAVQLGNGVDGLRVPAGWTLLMTNHVAPAAGTAWRANVPGKNF